MKNDGNFIQKIFLIFSIHAYYGPDKKLSIASKEIIFLTIRQLRADEKHANLINCLKFLNLYMLFKRLILEINKKSNKDINDIYF